MLRQTEIHHTSYLKEINISDNGYVFKNLISGQKYAVEVTAISTSGETKSSRIFNVSTEYYGNTKLKKN